MVDLRYVSNQGKWAHSLSVALLTLLHHSGEACVYMRTARDGIYGTSAAKATAILPNGGSAGR
jgi:hypothetical protein